MTIQWYFFRLLIARKFDDRGGDVHKVRVRKKWRIVDIPSLSRKKVNYEWPGLRNTDR